MVAVTCWVTVWTLVTVAVSVIVIVDTAPELLPSGETRVLLGAGAVSVMVTVSPCPAEEG